MCSGLLPPITPLVNNNPYAEAPGPAIHAIDPKQAELNREYTKRVIERAEEIVEFATGENPSHHGPHHPPELPHPIEAEGPIKPGHNETWTPSWMNRNGNAPNTRLRPLRTYGK